MVGAHRVIDGQQAVASVGVGERIHRPVLLGLVRRRGLQQAAAAQGQDIAVVVVGDEGEAAIIFFGLPKPGAGRSGRSRIPGHEVALQQAVERVVDVAVGPLHPVTPPPGLACQVAVVLLVRNLIMICD